MAYPMKLLPESAVMGADNFTRQTIMLNPSAGNSQTKYRGGDKIVFQIPAYKASFIDWSRSFLQFAADTASNQIRLCDGLPVVRRMVVSFGGVVIEDVSNYDTLEKVWKMTATKVGDALNGYLYGDFSQSSPLVVDATGAPATALTAAQKISSIIATEQSTASGTGEVYFKKLISGVLTEDYMFPVHRLNGGSMLNIELELASAYQCCAHTAAYGAATVAAAPAAADYWYELSQVRFQLELLRVSDEYFRKFNDAANSKELVLPITTFKSHVATFDKSQDNAVINIHSNSKDLKRVYVTMQDAQGTTSTQEAWKPKFAGGRGDDTRLAGYQFRYMNRNFPSSGPIVCGDNLQAALANALTNTKGSLMNEDLPLMCAFDRTSDNERKSIFQFNPIIVQNFSYDDDLVSGLNVNAASTPVICELQFAITGSPSGSRNVVSFTENSASLVLDENGNASIVQKRPAGLTE